MLRIGSPLFHFGIIGVFFGHVIGLGIPQSWTEAVGISEGIYHFMVGLDRRLLAGSATVVGMAILIYRRRTVGPVFSATTRWTRPCTSRSATVIFLGLFNTVGGSN